MWLFEIIRSQQLHMLRNGISLYSRIRCLFRRSWGCGMCFYWKDMKCLLLLLLQLSGSIEVCVLGIPRPSNWFIHTHAHILDHITSSSANFETVLSLLSSFFVPEDDDTFLSWIETTLGDKKLRSNMSKWRRDWQELVATGREGTALL